MGMVRAETRRGKGEEEARVEAWRIFAANHGDFAGVLEFHLANNFGVSPEEAIKDPLAFYKYLAELIGEASAKFVIRLIEEEAQVKGINVELLEVIELSLIHI